MLGLARPGWSQKVQLPMQAEALSAISQHYQPRCDLYITNDCDISVEDVWSSITRGLCYRVLYLTRHGMKVLL
jgi:hypothetical protein